MQAFDEITTEFLQGMAESGDPVEIERGPYHITIYVRRMEAWEIGEPDPAPEYRVHPITITAPLANKARSVGR